MIDYKELFNYNDYIELNKDLTHLKNNEDILNHWNNIGIKQMRLCNKKQLEIINEFGNETILYLPYYYYLYKNNLLFDNKIITYKGMKPFYYFLDTSNLVEKEENRKYIPTLKRSLLINNDDHVKFFNMQYWLPPPYKSIYNNKIFVFNKPILIIHNKYNIEWGIKCINFIDINYLRLIFSKLHSQYQIIYIRPTIKMNCKHYSYDHNQIIDEFYDYELIENEFKDIIILFNDLLKSYNYIYNELLLMLYSNCDNYISVQGGSAYLISYFFKKMIVLHLAGKEIESGSYDGWFQKTNREENKTLIICKSSEDVINNLNIF